MGCSINKSRASQEETGRCFEWYRYQSNAFLEKNKLSSRHAQVRVIFPFCMDVRSRTKLLSLRKAWSRGFSSTESPHQEIISNGTKNECCAARKEVKLKGLRRGWTKECTKSMALTKLAKRI